jgi:hypothetical protein
MASVEAELISWADALSLLRQKFPGRDYALPKSSGARGAEVLRLRLPYGYQLIRDGQFNWSGVPKTINTEDYQYSPIPLGIVIEKTIELYDTLESGGVERSIPLYLLRPGEYFGLFETFCEDFEQTRMKGTAGATTLLVVPPIGNYSKTEKFAKQFQVDLARATAENLKFEKKSKLAFGPFLASLIDTTRCSWRTDILLFPKAFVRDSLERNHAALSQILRTALNQMRHSYVRADQGMQLVQDHEDHETGDALAVRLIAHGHRPGFAPVLGVPKDECLLPATCMHEVLYGWNGRTGLIDEAHFPSILRPSIAGEASYYFLARPYFDGRPTRGSAQQRANNVREYATKREFPGVRSPKAIFEVIADEAAFTASIQKYFEQSERVAEIRPACHLVEGGMLLVHPRESDIP